METKACFCLLWRKYDIQKIITNILFKYDDCPFLNVCERSCNCEAKEETTLRTIVFSAFAVPCDFPCIPCMHR